MRNACDACRLRKVKCVAQDDPTAAGCVFCTSIGIPCHTTPRQRQRAKTGRKAASAAPKPPTPTYPTPGVPTPATPSTAPKLPSPPLSVPHAVFGYQRITQPAPPPAPSGGPRLLGVPGLTRQALDSCIETFFTTIGQVLRISLSKAMFIRRARVCLYYSAGLDVPAELADVADDPASPLFVLAIAFRGSLFSPHAALAAPLYAHCQALLEEPGTLTSHPCDSVEAVGLLSEQTIRPRHATATTLDPLGKGTVVDLMFYHRLHIPPPLGSRGYNRRLLLFAIICVHDAIRSASANTGYRISDGDMGWPLPVTEDGFPYISLMNTTRLICARLLSPRPKCLGLRAEDVLDALMMLKTMRERMKVSVDTLASSVAGDMRAPPMNGTRPMRAMEQLFLLSTHGWLHLVIWVAVQEDLERHPGMLPASALGDVHTATMAACEDMAALTELSLANNLLLHAPKSLRNHQAAFVLFLVRVYKNIPHLSMAQSTQYFGLTDILVRGVRGAALYPDSAPLADALQSALVHAIGVESRDPGRVAERGLDGLASAAADVQMSGPASAPAQPVDGLAAVGAWPVVYGSAEGSPLDMPSAGSGVVGGNGVSHASDPGPVAAAEVATGGAPQLVMAYGGPLPPVPQPVEVETLDWSELMETLKSCGFDLPVVPM